VRLCGAPIFIFLFVSPHDAEHLASLPFLLLLFLTDVFDGFLARRWKVASDFGYILDGVADRSAHIGVVIALTAKSALSPVLGFLLVFRDLLLYAARAFFEDWWDANATFRGRVKLAAVLFKLTVGPIAVMSYVRTVAPHAVAVAHANATLTFFHSATWLFVVWSYLLLAQQVHEYSSNPRQRSRDR
jgi:phosphatidylglycerophosphate synthase